MKISLSIFLACIGFASLAHADNVVKPLSDKGTKKFEDVQPLKTVQPTEQKEKIAPEQITRNDPIYKCKNGKQTLYTNVKKECDTSK